MRHRLTWLGFLWLTLTGCQLFQPKPFGDDPLLNHHPIQVGSPTPLAVHVPLQEPLVPSPPPPVSLPAVHPTSSLPVFDPSETPVPNEQLPDPVPAPEPLPRPRPLPASKPMIEPIESARVPQQITLPEGMLPSPSTPTPSPKLVPQLPEPPKLPNNATFRLPTQVAQAPQEPTSESKPSEPPATAKPEFTPDRWAGTYGHADDYSRLQGVLDHHYQGYWNLRFRDPSQDDRYGGKVQLHPSPDLEGFEDGDVILVVGELEELTTTGETPNDQMFPKFRIDKLWRLQSNHPKPDHAPFTP